MDKAAAARSISSVVALIRCLDEREVNKDDPHFKETLYIDILMILYNTVVNRSKCKV
jgi:hypothetical protein